MSRSFILVAAFAFLGLSHGVPPVKAEYIGECDVEVNVVESHPLAGLRSYLHWTDNGKDMLDNTMIIERVEGKTVYGRYSWEKTQPAWYISSSQCTREKGTIEGDVIVFKFPKNKGEARYRVRNGEVVGATYIYDGVHRFPGRIGAKIVGVDD